MAKGRIKPTKKNSLPIGGGNRLGEGHQQKERVSLWEPKRGSRDYADHISGRKGKAGTIQSTTGKRTDEEQMLAYEGGSYCERKKRREK